jgi:hypothetical protein
LRFAAGREPNSLRRQRRGDGTEADEAGFDVIDDLLGEDFGLGEIIEVGEAVVL